MSETTTHDGGRSTEPSEYVDEQDTEWKKHGDLGHASVRLEPWLDLSVSSQTSEDSEAVVELMQSGPEGVMLGLTARGSVDGSEGTIDALASLSGEQAIALGEELVEAGKSAARQE